MQLPEIRHVILVRHIRFLRILGVSAVRRPSNHTPIPHAKPIRLRVNNGRRIRRYHPRPTHGRNLLPLPNRLPVCLLPPARPTLLRRLWHAHRAGCVLSNGVLGEIQPCEPYDVTGR